jgi:hypothetical protein
VVERGGGRRRSLYSQLYRDRKICEKGGEREREREERP